MTHPTGVADRHVTGVPCAHLTGVRGPCPCVIRAYPMGSAMYGGTHASTEIRPHTHDLPFMHPSAMPPPSTVYREGYVIPGWPPIVLPDITYGDRYLYENDDGDTKSKYWLDRGRFDHNLTQHPDDVRRARDTPPKTWPTTTGGVGFVGPANTTDNVLYRFSRRGGGRGLCHRIYGFRSAYWQDEDGTKRYVIHNAEECGAFALRTNGDEPYDTGMRRRGRKKPDGTPATYAEVYGGILTAFDGPFGYEITLGRTNKDVTPNVWNPYHRNGLMDYEPFWWPGAGGGMGGFRYHGIDTSPNAQAWWFADNILDEERAAVYDAMESSVAEADRPAEGERHVLLLYVKHHRKWALNTRCSSVELKAIYVGNETGVSVDVSSFTDAHVAGTTGPDATSADAVSFRTRWHSIADAYGLGTHRWTGLGAIKGKQVRRVVIEHVNANDYQLTIYDGNQNIFWEGDHDGGDGMRAIYSRTGGEATGPTTLTAS